MVDDNSEVTDTRNWLDGGCILRAVETSRISVVRDIADRFRDWQQLIANDIPLLTAVPWETDISLTNQLADRYIVLRKHWHGE